KEFLDKIIDKRLVIQEAKRLGLQSDKAYIKEFNQYKNYLCVNKFYKEEIVNKIKVSEEEIKELYKKRYGKEESSSNQENYEKYRTNLWKEINSSKLELSGKEYLEKLKSELGLRIEEDFLNELEVSSVYPSNITEKKIALWKGGEVTDLELLERLKRKENEGGGTKRDILINLIEYKLIDQVALSKNYDKHDLDIQAKLEDKKNRLLYDLFMKNIITADIKVVEDELKDYYQNNLEEFLTPIKIKLESISLATMEEATEGRDELDQGADFSAVEGSKSKLDWIELDSLDLSVKKVVSSLNVGGISQIVKTNRGCTIYRVIDKKDAEQMKFEKVKEIVRQKFIFKKGKEIYNNYIDKLRVVSDIKVCEKLLALIEGQFTLAPTK
ncbi:MAG: peptidyl-prolyl cis-trans isomerase, partial [bacterium]